MLNDFFATDLQVNASNPDTLATLSYYENSLKNVPSATANNLISITLNNVKRPFQPALLVCEEQTSGGSSIDMELKVPTTFIYNMQMGQVGVQYTGVNFKIPDTMVLVVLPKYNESDIAYVCPFAVDGDTDGELGLAVVRTLNPAPDGFIDTRISLKMTASLYLANRKEMEGLAKTVDKHNNKSFYMGKNRDKANKARNLWSISNYNSNEAKNVIIFPRQRQIIHEQLILYPNFYGKVSKENLLINGFIAKKKCANFTIQTKNINNLGEFSGIDSTNPVYVEYKHLVKLNKKFQLYSKMDESQIKFDDLSDKIKDIDEFKTTTIQSKTDLDAAIVLLQDKINKLKELFLTTREYIFDRVIENKSSSDNDSEKEVEEEEEKDTSSSSIVRKKRSLLVSTLPSTEHTPSKMSKITDDDQ